MGAVGLAVATLLVLAAPAQAHTDLVSSDPPDDAMVAEPVDEVTLTFTQPVELSGAGVELLDADAVALAADVTVEAEVVTVRPLHPLDAGPYGVRWSVRSRDAHAVGGTFFFTVTAGEPDPAVASASESTTSQPTLATAEHTAAARSEAVAPPAAGGAPEHAVDRSSPALDAALAADAAFAVRWVDRGLRAVFSAVALGAVGALVFLIGVWDGSRREARTLTRLTARLAGAAALVVVAQVVVGSARSSGDWSEAVVGIPAMVTGSYAIGTALRLVGALLLATGCAALRSALRAPIAGGAVDVGTRSTDIASDRSSTAAQRVRAAPAATLGAVLIVASFAFVGHAATAASRVVATTAVVGHVAAAAVWGGGLLALVVTLATRRRAHLPLRASLVAARFSVTATIALVLATIAGVALASIRLDNVAALWTSSYGLVLLAKVAIVGLAAALGAHNHVVVVPALRREPDHPIGQRLRRLGLVEVVLLIVVLALTAVLVDLGA